MGTQKAIAAQIIEGKADYVLALKGNQETLHQAVIDYIDGRLEGDCSRTTGIASFKPGYGIEMANALGTKGSYICTYKTIN